MKKNKKLIIILPIIICVVVFLGVYFYLNHEDSNTSLTVLERKWIEDNSLTKVNLDILNDIPVIGNNGVGVLFDFANNFELETELEFNKIAYSKNGNPTSNELQFKLLSSDKTLTSNDLLLLEDGYILVGFEIIRYDDISQIKSKVIGSLASDASEVAYYTKTGTDLTYKSYNTVDELITALNSKEINFAVLPYLTYLDKTINLKDIYINYYFAEFSKKLVLSLPENGGQLNSIVKKYFNNWKNKRYVSSYNSQYLNYYITSKGMNDKSKADMLSKTYVYGYVENKPYEVEIDNKAYGISSEYIARIQRLTGIDIEYRKYNSISDLSAAVEKGDIDFYFDNFGLSNANYIPTMSPFVEKYVVLGNVGINEVVNSFEGLKGKNINILNNDLIFNYFRDNSKSILNPKNNLNELKSGNYLIVVDKEIYEYYKNSKFKGYEVLYSSNITNDYIFHVKNNNSDFYNLFNYVMGTNSYYNYRMMGLDSLDVSIIERTSFMEFYFLILGVILIPLLIGVLIYVFMKKKKQVKIVKKEDRIKYTDMLTSLKTRNYLNINIERWDSSKVYPKSVIVVDLNNISYVNETAGHEEGDKLIIKAASILVNTQLENSEIMRIDGNEFLIYLVGYSDKQIDTYSKKLVREFKDLPYGFGAAVGYSVINDDIKTIDDAINEASLAMKNNKEEAR